MKVTRVAAVAAGTLAAALLCSASLPVATAHGPGSPSPAIKSFGTPLDVLAAKSGIRFGTAVDMDAFNADATYKSHVAADFTTVTPENVMKWELLEPTRGTYNWGPADQLVAEAKKNRQLVHGHTLLWHSQLPGWLTSGVASGDIDAAELRQLVRKHIFDVVRHFKGKLWHWDVVNEVIDDNAQIRDTIFTQLLGPGYIADAFRWAHQADPSVKLYINDYNNEGLSAKSDAYFALIKQLKRDRVPVHGYGAQGHLGVQFGFYPADNIATNLQRFQDLGLEIAFTEVDVRMPVPSDPTKLQAQAQGYNALLQGCLLVSRCVQFTVWGFTDKYSWIPGWSQGREGFANILDENFQPKPAYNQIRNTLILAAGLHRRGN